ncbi:DUF5054 domain-containing protein [uncultured Sphaerochaeta sp.]|uniref:DUF5054 domain-containing protein n=1 Tax=uncultured Sphaerochaeta sp. TaxID=886478 RepID=UPI002A0A8274|nr:DUF5054 domain-containing protein [uncultured Sphaerochaeta sp.]
MEKTVYLVYKTHLDIGFTALSSVTIHRYMEQFIPNAIHTSSLLKESGAKERLCWTVGSWLVDYYLTNATPEQATLLEKSIQNKDIAYHGLPFTTYTEAMTPDLLEYALSIGKNLDNRFGFDTIAAKMTDVPGHTLSMVPYLAKSGIKFLHIGINGGSAIPDVPPIFRWVAPSGEEILVQYSASYGGEGLFPGSNSILAIENSADNSGPPSVAEIKMIYTKLEHTYPGARIVASSLDDYARSILPLKDAFPILDKEIGDTWIHGIASDPYKLARYRLFLSISRKWLQKGLFSKNSVTYRKFMGQLLMIPEHTWGLDMKKYLPDYKNWDIKDFEKARKEDKISIEAIPQAYAFIEEFTQKEVASIFKDKMLDRHALTYSFFESSWKEQRAYLDSALKTLPPYLKTRALKAEKDLIPEPFCQETGDKDFSDTNTLHLFGKTIIFSDSGAIMSIKDENNLQILCSEGFGAFYYQIFSAEDYLYYNLHYNRDFEKHKIWIWPDFGKPGMETVQPPVQNKTYFPRTIQRILRKNEVIISLGQLAEAPKSAPRKLTLRYSFNENGLPVRIALDWFDKKATRLPESMLFSFDLGRPAHSNWKMIKLGYALQPDRTVSNGARSIHCVDCIQHDDLSLTPLDSPLVSIGGKAILAYDNLPAQNNGKYVFIIQNNIWGTNHPLWYEQDGRTRFEIEWNTNHGERDPSKNAP